MYIWHTGKYHFTEVALLKVHSDIIVSMDRGEVTALTLLDLSPPAFDTIVHVTLTNRHGISGHAQIWFSSYLKENYITMVTAHLHITSLL